MSWLPAGSITVNVEALSDTLRSTDVHPLFFFRSLRFTAVHEELKPGQLLYIKDAPTRAIPFPGVFMPRPEWVW